MKKILIFILFFLVIIDIVNHNFINNIINFFPNLLSKNNYKLIYNSESINSKYKYKEFSNNIKNINNFTIKDKNQILSIYYTILNNGMNDFSFYCDKTYKNCFDDISEISNNNHIFSYINSLIHPYNSFKLIHSNIINNDRIDVTIDKKYSKDEIDRIDNKINEIINSLNINNYSSVYDKIKLFHDYIINTNKYDKLKEDSNTSPYHSDSAIGTLFEGYSICSGYTDTMGIFLDKLGIANIRIITDNHTWNAININDTWYHIDLTWDDPINAYNKDILSHDYFMLRTNELLSKDLTEHNFDKNMYNFIN